MNLFRPAPLPTPGRLSSTFLAVRSGAFVPMVLLAAASHLPAGLAAVREAAAQGYVAGASLRAAVGAPGLDAAPANAPAR